ncbi:hypothetical protein M595_0423 [Lyngbya aestuarii BL J]|uniref:Uncharacterized protein n=1 Tax=Lyngbya aestuarii BL J TaxID=1348334 RepID=U7QP44_9CYAN|nr:hypothetical protein M595_0423 [Lyngbya aestuarii BL J]
MGKTNPGTFSGFNILLFLIKGLIVRLNTINQIQLYSIQFNQI